MVAGAGVSVCGLGGVGVFLGDGGGMRKVPGLPESSDVAGYVAGDAEIWGVG